MKKGLKFTKDKLEELYLKQKLSLFQISELFGCNASNIFYWLKKYNINRRPINFRCIHIPKGVLEDLYWKKGKKPKEIAKIYGIKNERTIRKKLEKYNIKRKTVSEALTKKFKANFSGDLEEKSFFLGLRIGDFYARRKDRNIRVQTTTTHRAQIYLLRDSFERYGELRKYYSKSKHRTDEWFIYVDLNESFSFLIKKLEKIPEWILENDDYFFKFLAAYSDCEANWHATKSHNKHFRFTFRLRTSDIIILKQIKKKFEDKGFSPKFYNTGKPRIKNVKSYKNIHAIILNKKKDNITLIKKLLPLSKHSEKIRKMKLILDNKSRSWKEVEPLINKLKKEIEKEITK